MTEREPPASANAASGEGPRYARIQKILEARLIEGVYPVDSVMPTENELASEFDTSRFTIREALRHLRECGLQRLRLQEGPAISAEVVECIGHIELHRHRGFARNITTAANAMASSPAVTLLPSAHAPKRTTGSSSASLANASNRRRNRSPSSSACARGKVKTSLPFSALIGASSMMPG